MARSLTTDQKTAVTAPHVKRAMLVHFDLLVTPLRLTNAFHDLVVGADTYVGRGAWIQHEAAAEDGTLEAHKVKYVLSGLSPAFVSLALSEPIEGRPFTESLILFNPDTNQPIGNPVVVMKGRLSRMTIAGPLRRQ